MNESMREKNAQKARAAFRICFRHDERVPLDNGIRMSLDYSITTRFFHFSLCHLVLFNELTK